MRPPAQSRFIPTLDGWRALAVVMVIICHECLEHNPGFAWMAPLGAVGVRIFFGISGYLICTLLLIEWEATSRISLKNFYVRRVFRILPPALAYLSFLALATMLGWNLVNRSSILTCIFLMANNLSVGYFVNHFWSLSLEEQFYLLWPALLVYAGKVRSARFAAIALILVPLWRFLYTWVHHAPAPANRSDMTLDVFFAPCLMAIIFFDSRNRERAQRMLSFKAVSLLAVVAGIEFFILAPQVRKLLFTMMVPAIVVSTVLHPEWRISRLLELQSLKWVGRISYSLYLWQQLFTSHLLAQPFAIRMLALFATAAASYYIIEQPSIRLGRNLIAQTQTQAHIHSATLQTSG